MLYVYISYAQRYPRPIIVKRKECLFMGKKKEQKEAELELEQFEKQEEIDLSCLTENQKKPVNDRKFKAYDVLDADFMNIGTEIAINGVVKIEDSPYRGVIDDLMFKKNLSTRAIELWLQNNAPKHAQYTTSQLNSYRNRRENDAKFILNNMEEYRNFKMAVKEEVNNSILAMRNVDIVQQLTEVIGDVSDRLSHATPNAKKIQTAKDYNDTQRILLETIKLYGELMLLNERYHDFVDKRTNPQASKPQTTININLKESLADILKTATQNGDYSAVDQMRDIIDIPSRNVKEIDAEEE